MEEGRVQPRRRRVLRKGWLVMRRGDALIRDIARLFVKYGTNDWAVVVQLLRTGGPEYTQIAQAIESILATTKSVRDRRSTNLPKLPKPELTIRLMHEGPVILYAVSNPAAKRSCE